MPISRPEFLILIYLLCVAHRASVTSGYRTEKRNAEKGGLPNSLHLTGMAADLVCDEPAQAPLLVLTAKRLGLNAVIEADHVHIEADPRHP